MDSAATGKRAATATGGFFLCTASSAEGARLTGRSFGFNLLLSMPKAPAVDRVALGVEEVAIVVGVDVL